MMARFTQGDRIVPDEMDPSPGNRHAYVVNNPMRYANPSGRYPEHNTWMNCGGTSSNPDQSQVPYEYEPPPGIGETPNPVVSPCLDTLGQDCPGYVGKHAEIRINVQGRVMTVIRFNGPGVP